MSTVERSEKYGTDQLSARSLLEPLFWISWGERANRIGIIVAGAALIFLLVLLKSKTTVEFDSEPYLFSYGIFVTTFILSRIIASMFYESSFATIYQDDTFAASVPQTYEPRVAFIIPCKNEEYDIVNTIDQCYRADYPSEKTEVIVINDGSTDRTLDVLRETKGRYPSLKIISWSRNRGKRAAMAAGFKKAHADILIQLDSDSYIEPSTFRDLIAPFRNRDVAAVCASGVPKNADKNFVTRMQAAYYFMSFRIMKAAESTYDTVFCCSGCCSAYRKSAVMPVLHRWLKEKFLGRPVTWGDDRALTSHLLREGKRTVFSATATAFTVVPENWKKLFVQQLRWKKSWIVNFFFTARFIIAKQPFVALFYYFPLVAISFLAPFMTFRALVLTPLTKGTLPLYHVMGVVLLTSVVILYYRLLDRKNGYWPYLYAWSLFNLFALSFVIVWAAIRIQDRRWGTR